MAGLTFLADSKARSIALYVDLPFRRLPTIPMILTDPAAAPNAKLGREATEAAAAPRNRRRFMLLIKNVFVCVLGACLMRRCGSMQKGYLTATETPAGRQQTISRPRPALSRSDLPPRLDRRRPA